MKRNWIILMLPLLMLGVGCKTVEYQELNGVSMLTGHPQFPVAAQQAPEFTRSALREVARLNHIIRSK
jgi:hypothetical protein